MTKECEYIQTEGGQIYVARPTSWIGGMARHQWLRRHFGKAANISIASPGLWKSLCEDHDVQVARED